MATQIICDECGEPINLTEAYYQVVATKVRVDNADDPTLPNTPTVVEIAQSFDYHDGHQPKHSSQADLEPTHPIVEPDEPEPEPEPIGPVLSELDPSTATKGAAVTLRVLGAGFTEGDKIVFNGSEITTTFVSDTELTAEPNTSSLGKSTYDVLVRHDGADTAALQFQVT
jgi:hypothetical protein